MSLTLAPEILFTLTLCFWDSKPGCRPETIESPAMQIVLFGDRQSSLLSDVTLSFISLWLIQIGFIFVARFRWVNFIFQIFFMNFFRNSVICSTIDLEQIGFFGKGSLGILSLSNVKISTLSTNFVIFNSAGLAWLSFPVFQTFCILPMVVFHSLVP